MSGNGAASYGDLLITSIVVLAGVCVAAFIVVKVVGRFLTTGRMRGAHLLDVIARLPLEPRRSLYVVAVGGKTLLVGTSEMGLSVLSELDGNEVRANVVPKQSFGDLVMSVLGRRTPREHGARADDVSAGTHDAHVGAKATDDRRDEVDVSAETHDAKTIAGRRDEVDVSTETRDAHVGAKATDDRRDEVDVSAGTRDAHVGASDRETP